MRIDAVERPEDKDYSFSRYEFHRSIYWRLRIRSADSIAFYQ